MKSFLVLSFLPKSTDGALLIWRVAVGGMMAALHGWPKLLGLGKMLHTFPDPLGIGSEASYVCTVLAEFLAGVMLALGLCTRWAALGIAFTMTIAFFVVNEANLGEAEPALLYLVAVLPLVVAGGGRFSLDAKLLGRG